MQYGVSRISVIPIRNKPSDAAEMVSQLLFGELYEVVEERRKWLRIKCLWDNYTGWIDRKQHHEVEQNIFEKLQNNCAYALEIVEGVSTSSHFLPILMGSTLPNCDGLNFNVNGTRYIYSGQLINPSEVKITNHLIIKIARKYLFAPYLWGGRSPFGIDCSGFTQNIFKMAGIPLLRDSSQQVHQGENVDFFEEARPGDLAFFENAKGKIVHVGLILPNDQIIHASGQVRIDAFDRTGIYNHEKRRYSHRLRVSKRILPDEAFIPILTD